MCFFELKKYKSPVNLIVSLMAINIQIYELFSTSYLMKLLNLKLVLISIFRKSKDISLQKQNIVR